MGGEEGLVVGRRKRLQGGGERSAEGTTVGEVSAAPRSPVGPMAGLALEASPQRQSGGRAGLRGRVWPGALSPRTLSAPVYHVL